LRELKANTAQLPASKVDQVAVKAASDSVFKLSGSFKKPGAPEDDRFEPLIQPVRDTTFYMLSPFLLTSSDWTTGNSDILEKGVSDSTKGVRMPCDIPHVQWLPSCVI